MLKHTLFLEEEVLSKMRRTHDSAQLLFIADDTKIKGNREYDLGNYYKSLEIYEWVLGCYLWLEFLDEDTKTLVREKLECPNGVISDEEIRVCERQVMVEADRDLEKDMSKIKSLTSFR